MRPLLALLLTLAACSGQTSATAPAEAPPQALPEPDKTAEKPADAPAEEANFADPKAVDDPPAEKPEPATDPALANRVKERFGADCRLERTCGDLLGVDCKAAVDGPYYYAQKSDLKTVATCGGACMSGRCTDCPPKAWTCPTY
jgi:hypothetical protein